MSDARGERAGGNGLRRAIVATGVVVATLGLVWRAADLQVNHKEFLQSEGRARHLRIVTVNAHRGRILDRNGEPLAISTPVDSVWANPGEWPERDDRWQELVELLGLDDERVERAFSRRRDREFLYLRRHVEPETAERVRALDVDGVYLQREYRRYYPLGEAGAHVVGFTNVDDEGQEGLELAWDERLRGIDGAKRVLRDRIGQVVEDVESIREPHPGEDLILSIDRRIQYLAYRALASAVRRHGALGGSVVVLDAESAEVLAMVNQPSYNPNNRNDRVSARIRNRAVTDQIEPGSTIKPFTIAAALTSGHYRPHTPVDTTPGRLRVGSHTVHDFRDYGMIDVAAILQKSSNVGASKLALAIEPKTLWQTFSRAGFGSTTGGGFPGEAQGVLTHFFGWGEVERVTLSYGYGLAATPLQLAQAYAVIASGGILRPVRFVRDAAPATGVRAMRADVANQLRRMLGAVVAPGGTGVRASVPGYRIAGKTGTVHKSTAGGYAEDRYVATFAGFGPVSSPRLVMVVVIDEPSSGEHFGGRVAAPVFSEVAEGAFRVLGIAPDDRVVPRRRIALDPEPPPPAGLHAAVHGDGARKVVR